MRKTILGLLFLLLALRVLAQPSRIVSLRILPTFQHQPIVLNDIYYKLPGGDSVLFETIRGYISNITCYKAGKGVYREKNSYHLVDAADENGMQFDINLPQNISFDALAFDLGIDSTTNVSGALVGDLDPSKGMYWAWQTGYINFKLEGKSNKCPTRKNEFQFHLGGYAGTAYALQHIKLSVADNNDIIITLPIDNLLSVIDLSKQNLVMIPGPEAVRLAAKLAGLFEVQAQ